VSQGGENCITNLITSCFDCNRGKGKRKLSDNTTIKKQKKSLDELQRKREQIEMMAEWHNELLETEKREVELLCDAWTTLLNENWVFNEAGKSNLKRYLTKYSFREIVDAMKIAIYTYVFYDEDGKATENSVEIASKKLGGILYINKEKIQNPEIDKAYHIVNILNNRFRGNIRQRSLSLLKRSMKYDIDLDSEIEIAKTIKRYDDWENYLINFLKENEQ
jgi:hypothetical protein